MTEQEMITVEKCKQQINLMARRLALLDYFFSKTIIDHMGEEEGKAMIKEAIWAYGQYCGKAVMQKVDEMGLPLTEVNFDKVPDLPEYGWDVETHTLENGEVRPIVRFCPIAAGFKELGPEAEKVGRLYCYVDQAKYAAYNEEMAFIHKMNLLDGDPYCEFLIKKKEDEV